MASRFVSAGGAEVKAPEGLSSATDDAWAKARQQVEESKKPIQQGPAPGTQEGGISLFEHLQNQKAAKQEAFEEASKLRNQFRPLDDGEVDFLEGIKQKERLKVATERQETAEQLEAFRRSRAAAEGLPDGGLIASVDVNRDVPEDASVWTTTKKRRKIDPSGKPEPMKMRKLSPKIAAQTLPAKSEDLPKPENTKEETGRKETSKSVSQDAISKTTVTKATAPTKALISYDSDSDD